MNMVDFREMPYQRPDLAEHGERMKRAAELLHRDGLDHDGYSAFVCEKCAPTFAYYGYFITAEALAARSEELVKRV